MATEGPYHCCGKGEMYVEHGHSVWLEPACSKHWTPVSYHSYHKHHLHYCWTQPRSWRTKKGVRAHLGHNDSAMANLLSSSPSSSFSLLSKLVASLNAEKDWAATVRVGTSSQLCFLFPSCMCRITLKHHCFHGFGSFRYFTPIGWTPGLPLESTFDMSLKF